MVRILFLVLVLHVCSHLAVAQNLSEIVVEGNARIEDSTVLLQVSSEVGKGFDARTVERDIKEIYRTGFFEQVTAVLRQTNRGTVLAFKVEEKPAIREIRIAGNDEVSEDTIREKLNLPVRRFLDRLKLASSIEELEKYYQTQGFYGTKITYDVEPVQENQVDVTFEIEEGNEKVIREVVIEGNQQVDEDDLLDVIATARYRWWVSWALGTGIVKEEQLAEDVRRMTQYYLTKGFVDVKVTEPVVSDIEDGLRVTFRVDEGAIYDFGEITASGDLFENSREQTLTGIKSQTGEVFNVERLREDTFTISEKYTDIGYAFANVDPVTSINRTDRTVKVDFAVDKGKLIHIDRIVISGNEKTRDNVIRRTMRINERELFSSSKIKRSQELLQRLGYFDEVTITPEPSVQPEEVDLAVAVREGQTGTFTIGAGV
ncbi:MAG: outer membrane protein assembly factor BamA, partial [Bdellovibrionales bacterium]|nr:outer membrane protein assembly factor BamA [Bdellovibrionales bacterium]